MFVVTGIKDLIGALGGFKPALAVATTATIAFKMAMAGVLGPIGLVAVGIAGLVTVVANLAGEFETVGERLEAIEERAQEIRGKGAGKQFANEEIKGKMWAKEDEFRAAELESKKWAKGEGPVAVKREREARRKSMNAQAELGKLEAENRRLLAGQAAEDASAKEKKTRGEARKVRSDRIAELEKAGKLKKGRGLEKRKNDFMMGKISESELIGKPKRRKGGGGSAPAKEPESDVTLAESLLAIRTGTADPKQLKQVIQQLSRKTPSSKSIKPTVAIDFFNFVITQNIKGANPTQIAKESAMAIRGEFEKQTAKAGQTVPTGIAR
jgi:hypothetical protein